MFAQDLKRTFKCCEFPLKSLPSLDVSAELLTHLGITWVGFKLCFLFLFKIVLVILLAIVLHHVPKALNHSHIIAEEGEKESKFESKQKKERKKSEIQTVSGLLVRGSIVRTKNCNHSSPSFFSEIKKHPDNIV